MRVRSGRTAIRGQAVDDEIDVLLDQHLHVPAFRACTRRPWDGGSGSSTPAAPPPGRSDRSAGPLQHLVEVARRVERLELVVKQIGITETLPERRRTSRMRSFRRFAGCWLPTAWPISATTPTARLEDQGGTAPRHAAGQRRQAGREGPQRPRHIDFLTDVAPAEGVLARVIAESRAPSCRRRGRRCSRNGPAEPRQPVRCRRRPGRDCQGRAPVPVIGLAGFAPRTDRGRRHRLSDARRRRESSSPLPHNRSRAREPWPRRGWPNRRGERLRRAVRARTGGTDPIRRASRRSRHEAGRHRRAYQERHPRVHRSSPLDHRRDR